MISTGGRVMRIASAALVAFVVVVLCTFNHVLDHRRPRSSGFDNRLVLVKLATPGPAVTSPHSYAAWVLTHLLSIFRSPVSPVTKSPDTGGVRAVTEVPKPLCLLPGLGIEAPDSGGSWRPRKCTARHRIAVLVPYRNRGQRHLDAFLRHMHPFLQRQMLQYTIYVVEQTNASSFNRGMLLNIGFAEASKRQDHECYFFHDVDLLPEKDSNIYSCPDKPRHFAAARSNINYRVTSRTYFGGVSALRPDHFRLMNGFSNKYFGWGSEDDDLYKRLKLRKLTMTRVPMDVGRYKMLPHRKEVANPHRRRSWWSFLYMV